MLNDTFTGLILVEIFSVVKMYHLPVWWLVSLAAEKEAVLYVGMGQLKCSHYLPYDLYFSVDVLQ